MTKCSVATLLASAGLSALAACGPDARELRDLATPPQVYKQALEQGFISARDKAFLGQAASDVTRAIELAEAVLKRSKNPDIKQFAQQEVDSQKLVHEDLVRLATTRRINLSGEMDEAGVEQLEALRGAADGALDRAYMTYQVENHAAAVEAFREAAQGADDVELRAWADHGLAMIEEHLAQARSLLDGLGR
jgi:putative membrane protein